MNRKISFCLVTEMSFFNFPQRVITFLLAIALNWITVSHLVDRIIFEAARNREKLKDFVQLDTSDGIIFLEKQFQIQFQRENTKLY